MRTIDEIRAALARRFVGSRELAGHPLRTRGKVAKVMVCEALGLPVPKSFARTTPRFPSEDLDVSVQKANNFQLWNASLHPDRRYAFVILSGDDTVHAVRVVSGADLERLDDARVATIKRQAGFAEYATAGLRVVGSDTGAVTAWPRTPGAQAPDPAAPPDGRLLPLDGLGLRLAPLIGTTIDDPGAVQERLRGQALHVRVTRLLGYAVHRDTGQHPDVPNQLLELKLQTSRTIDLGVTDPPSTSPLGPPFPPAFRHADVRYAVFGGTPTGDESVHLTSLVLVSGANFFTAFRRFGGLDVNSKLQFHLPPSWWR